MFRNWKLLIGVVIFAAYVALAFTGAFIETRSDMALDRRLLPPFQEFFLGSDENGMSLASQLLGACFLSVSLSLVVTLLSGILGTALGAISGIFGGKVDDAFMRGIEVVQAFPNFLLALSLLAALGPSYVNLVIAMTLTTWVGFAKLVRAETMHLKSLDFVEASRGFGASRLFLIIRHILPQQSGLLLVHASYTVAGVIVAEAGLSFLGLGLPADVPSWGQLINRGRPYLSEAPHIALLPSLMLSGFILSFYLLGDGIQKYLNPKATS